MLNQLLKCYREIETSVKRQIFVIKIKYLSIGVIELFELLYETLYFYTDWQWYTKHTCDVVLR